MSAGDLGYCNATKDNAEILTTLSTPLKVKAFLMVSNKWSNDEWLEFHALVQKESGWKPNAQNPTSTAYGLLQFLDSTWAGVGCIKTSDPEQQLRCGLRYVEDRYETPSLAMDFHAIHNWY